MRLLPLLCLLACVDPGKTLETSWYGLVTLDSTGSPCTGAGWTWNSATSTCTLTADFPNQSITVAAAGVTLDCAGFRLCTTDGIDCDDPVRLELVDPVRGVLAAGYDDVTIKNCEFLGFNQDAVSVGIALLGDPPVSGIHLENLKVVGNSAYTNPAPDATVYTKNPKHGISIQGVEDSTFYGLEVSGSAQGAVSIKGTYANSQMVDVYLHHNLSVGVEAATATGSDRSNNLFENVTDEQTDGRSAVGMTLVGFTDTIVRHPVLRPDPSVAGPVFLVGIQIQGSRNVIEFADIRGAKQAGITQVFSGPGVTGSLTIRNSSITESGGGVVLPTSSAITTTLVDNYLCNDPMDRYVHSSGLTYSDITRRFSSTNTAGNSYGQGNVCGYTSYCTQGTSSFTCVDGGTNAYRDLGAPSTNPCTFLCP